LLPSFHLSTADKLKECANDDSYYFQIPNRISVPYLPFFVTALILVFLSKLRATGCFLVKSPIAIHMYEDSHELHVYCGWTILYCSGVHGIFHTCRWANQGNLNLLYQHFSGISGLIIMSSCLLICLPMTIFKNRIRYEIRKGLHYFFVLFALALCFHTPRSAIPNGGFSGYVFATISIWYLLDCAYCLFFVTEKIDTTKFSVMPTGVKMTMIVSARFQKAGNHGGVCYVCLPWISKYQWHAFSLFENPRNPMAEREIFIQKSGDWTCQVHCTLQRETVRPAWVQGPFPSPYSNADAYDNQILVDSGIGITPALSVIRAHKDTRRINLIWICRDESLLKFILQHLYLDHQGWNLIFYTGKSKLGVTNADVLPNSKVCIIEGRPKLPHLIPNIIFGIEVSLSCACFGIADRGKYLCLMVFSSVWTRITREVCACRDARCVGDDCGANGSIA
jgi:ferric-chelate reductase